MPSRLHATQRTANATAYIQGHWGTSGEKAAAVWDWVLTLL